MISTRKLSVVCLSFAISAQGFAGSEHDHDHDHDHGDELGVIAEDGACVGLLGRSGEPGVFAPGSDALELSKEVSQCNLCVEFGEDAESCVDADLRKSILDQYLVGGMDAGTRAQPGRFEGGKVYFELNQGRRNPFKCHFHSYEAGEIDCH